MIGVKTHRPGFTLIELLIVASLFALTSLLATTVFSNIQSTQRAVSGQQRVATDGRYILETISQSVRTGSINYTREDATIPYSYELTSPSVDNTLSTVDAVGQVTCYRFNGANKTVEVFPQADNNCDPDSPNWTAFTPDDLEVESLKFYISPPSDPNRPVPRNNADCKISTPTATQGFDSTIGACRCEDVLTDCYRGQTCDPAGSTNVCVNPNVQPQVTIYLKSHSKKAGPGEQAEITLQTTVVSRIYQR